MTLSILHRLTGMALSGGFILLACWLASAADGEQSYGTFTAVMGSAAGRVLLVLLSLAFFFHLANGIRHLVWDLGFGFEIPQANASSWVVLVATVVLTLLYWLVL